MTTDSPTPAELTPLAPKDAIAYFRSKGLKTSFAWQDHWQDAHAQAFTVAKMTQVSLLEDTRALVDLAISEGWTLERFQKELKPRLQAAGWWGKQEMTDPKTGETKLVQLGSDRRIRTIFATNTRVAYQAGAWSRIWRTREDLPYLQYIHNSYKFPRIEHKAWDGLCLPVDDPWWDTHYPPCGWGCKCSTRSLSAKMMAARGLKVSKPVRFPPKLYRNPRTGEDTLLEAGIDPGWNYNVGKSPLRPITARPLQPRKGTASLSEDENQHLGRSFLARVGAPADRPVIDPDGHPIAINEGLFINAAGRYTLPRPDLVEHLTDAADTLKAPTQREWLWQDDKVRADMTAMFNRADPGKDTRSFLDIGPVPAWLLRFTDKLDLPMGAFTVRAHETEVRHTRKRHPDVTKDAYLQVGKVLERPDRLVTGLLDPQGDPAIALMIQRPDEVHIYFFSVRTGARELALRTIYRRLGAIDVLDPEDLFRPNVRNDPSRPFNVEKLEGKIKPPPQALIRRYTKRLDNQVVTVDFSPSLGTWTFDVQSDPE